MNPVHCDIAIFGGGVAGLWTLDHLRRAGYACVLLESAALGAGQTVASQGIIHGGLKYTLDGLLNPAARAIREMPELWRNCLRGAAEPALTDTRVRAEWCCLWRTDDLLSRIAMVGATSGLRVAPQRLARHERPPVLRACPGSVYRLDEQVIDPRGLVANLAARNAGALLACDPRTLVAAVDGSALRFAGASLGFELVAQRAVITAGRGAADLRARLGLPADAMQLRPLHMTLLRGALPELNGHCVDRARTRVTVTTDRDAAGRTIWQVGGQVAEDGVNLAAEPLARHVRDELCACVPGLELTGAEWATYRVDRAESTAGGRRPSTETLLREGPLITAWPTKLALAPRLAERLAAAVADVTPRGGPVELPADVPRPAVAAPPWEREDTAWFRVD